MFGKKSKKGESVPEGNHVQQASTEEMPLEGTSVMPVTSESVQAYSASSYSAKSRKKLSGGKRALIALGVVVVVLAAVYGAGVFYFTNHFFPNTVLNDEDFSWQPSDSLASDIQSQADNYSLTIEGEGFEYTFKTGEAVIDIDANQIAADAAARQEVMQWPLEMLKTHDVSDLVVASYDADALAETLKTVVSEFNKDQTPSENASIVYDDSREEFVVQSEVYGSQIDADVLIAKVDTAVKCMATDVEVTGDDLIKPTILSEDERMDTALQTVSDMFPKNITLTLNDSVEVATIDKATFTGWITLSDDYEPSLDDDAIASWIEDENLSSMNTVGTKRTWTRADGKKCTASGGTYGWQVDTSSLVTTITDTITSKESSTIDIPCSQSADVYSGAGKRDWGSYVDIDLSQQKVRYYDANDKLLYEADCVTGSVSAGHDTPTGIYYLNSKQSPCVLTGRTSTGAIDYQTTVQYWMPFIRSSIGLHDATWRSSFGGSIYKTNGSHGCVNLSTKDAKWFYNNLSTGVCVITHY